MVHAAKTRYVPVSNPDILHSPTNITCLQDDTLFLSTAFGSYGTRAVPEQILADNGLLGLFIDLTPYNPRLRPSEIAASEFVKVGFMPRNGRVSSDLSHHLADIAEDVISAIQEHTIQTHFVVAQFDPSGEFSFTHEGACQLYHFHAPAHLEQLTEDRSQAQVLRRRDIPAVHRISPGDVYLLCSPEFSKRVPEVAIKQILTQQYLAAPDDDRSAVRALLTAAHFNGARCSSLILGRVCTEIPLEILYKKIIAAVSADYSPVAISLAEKNYARLSAVVQKDQNPKALFALGVDATHKRRFVSASGYFESCIQRTPDTDWDEDYFALALSSLADAAFSAYHSLDDIDHIDQLGAVVAFLKKYTPHVNPEDLEKKIEQAFCEKADAARQELLQQYTLSKTKEYHAILSSFERFSPFSETISGMKDVLVSCYKELREKACTTGDFEYASFFNTHLLFIAPETAYTSAAFQQNVSSIRYQKAAMLFEIKDYKQVLEHFSLLPPTTYHNGKGAAFTLLAKTYLASGEKREACAALEEAVQQSHEEFHDLYKTEKAEAIILLAEMLWQDGETARTIALLTEGYAVCPQNEKIGVCKKRFSEEQFKKGFSALENKQYVRARNRLSEALALDAENIDAQYFLGLVHLERKEYTAAIPRLETAVSQISEKQRKKEHYSDRINKSAVYLGLAQADSNIEHYEQAASALLRARLCAPKSKQIPALVAQTQKHAEKKGRESFDNHDYETALSHLTAAQKLGASGSWLAWRIGRCHEGLRDYDAARQQYATLLQEDSTFVNAQIGLRRLKRLEERQ